VDQCLEFNYKTVPVISDWENQRKFRKSEPTNWRFIGKAIVLDNKAISKQLKDKTILITGAAGSIEVK
jgi:FlaA1/EpsC-like NDP-sugar epimerase